MKRRRITYELRCPNPECPQKYHYWISVFRKPDWERCPICGYFGEIEEFILVVQCKICGEKFSGKPSDNHKGTGHNSWALLMPKEVKNESFDL